MNDEVIRRVNAQISLMKTIVTRQSRFLGHVMRKETLESRNTRL